MNKKKYILIFSIIISVLIPMCVEEFYFKAAPWSYDRIVAFSSLLLFISLQYYIGVKKVWNIVFKRRYIIAVLIFAFMVINGYHGASITLYNERIQPSVSVENGSPILGENRTIRSDEWAVSTPLMLSQATPINNFDIVNHTIMARDSKVILYPKYPVKDISILASPNQIPYLLLPVEAAFSASWNIVWFILFFATFEFLRILTGDKRLISLVGATFITLAPAVQWWEAWNMIAYGEIAMIFFYKFIHSNSLWKKIVYSILIGWIGSCYIMTMYPAWMVPYGYFFLAVVIWLIVSNKKKLKIKDFLLLIPVAVGVMVVIIAPAFIQGAEVYDLLTNTVYPGARLSTGDTEGWKNMFNMFTNLATPFKMAENQCEMSQFFSFFPVPMVLAGIASFKNYRLKRNDFLLNALLLVSVFLSIWNFVELPEFLVKITMLSMSTVSRCNIALGFINCIILLLLISKYHDQVVSTKNIIIRSIVAIAYVAFGILIAYGEYPSYMSWKISLLTAILLLPIVAMLIIGDKRLQKYLLSGLVMISIIGGIAVHPWNKGLASIYEKPVSKAVQELVAKDETAVFMTVNMEFYYSNYMCANGAKVINTTNFYPNFDFWQKIDSDGSNEEIYNRYSHIWTKLTHGETTYKLKTDDLIDLQINLKDIDKFDVDYLISGDPLEEYSSEEYPLKQIYSQEGMYIYSLSN